nr:uncharacterized protein LOC121127673 [Lepeophtheirus salmonis]
MNFENQTDHKLRIRSLYVIHVSMLVFSLGFSINLTGVFPYMKQLLPNISSDVILNRYGWVIAMNPLGQMIASPLLGYIFNKTNNLRMISIAMSLCYVLGNVLYAILTMIPTENGRLVGLLASRFISGFAFGIAAPMRAYISSSTYIEEKTKHLSLASLFQTMGFIIGPGIQATLTPLQCGNPPGNGAYFALDMYTVAGWLSAFMGILLLILFLPIFFRPFDVTLNEKTAYAAHNRLNPRDMILQKPDYLAAFICLFDFFVFQATFVLLETLATPLCMDQFAWSEEKTVLYLGIIMSVGGIISLICFFTIAPLSKRIDERYLYHVLGIVMMNVGRFFLFSFGSDLPPRPVSPLSGTFNSSTLNTFYFNDTVAHNVSSISFVENQDCSRSNALIPGCSYDWCDYVPALKLWQVLLSYAICSISFPYCITLCAVIFSKIIGPRPQGLWMGALASSGSLARVSGPILVSYAYKLFGINVTSALITILTLISLIITLIGHNRMVPLMDSNLKNSDQDSEEAEPCRLGHSKMNENPEQRKRRLRSIYVVHTSMFVFSLGFSINLTGVFPYMKQLLTNNSSDDILNRYGWVVAMNPLGQMIASPLLGYIFNKTNDLRSISMAMAVVYILGNSLYSILSLFPEGESRYIGLLSSRFIVGFASGISAPLRAYISSSTFFNEKTKHLSIVALFQTLGFIVGPGIQASLTPLKCGQPPISGPYFTLDMYTVAGWLSVFMGVCMMILFSPYFFQPFDVTVQERSLHNRNKTEADTKSISLEKPDYLAALISLLNFFVFQAVFVLLETLGTPLCMDNFAWSEETTVFYLGIIMSSGGVMSFICFLTIPPLSKKFDERYLYYILGIIPLNIARIFLFSFGDELPPTPTNINEGNVSSIIGLRNSIPFVNNDDCSLSSSTGTGCDYDWCNYVPVLQLWQMLVSYAVGSTSIPFCVTICSIIFTKLLGPRPQGVWMGALASSGSFARVIGPIIVSYIYRIYGTNVTSGLMLVLTLFSLFVSIIFHKRMVPLHEKMKSDDIEITKL